MAGDSASVVRHVSVVSRMGEASCSRAFNLMNPYPVEGLAALVGALKLQGFSDAAIELMGRHNPRRLFNLDGEGMTPRK